MIPHIEKSASLRFGGEIRFDGEEFPKGSFLGPRGSTEHLHGGEGTKEQVGG